MRRGRKTTDERLALVREALRVLHDPIALEDTRLAASSRFQRLGQERYGSRVCAVGRAMSLVFVEALQEIAQDLADTPVGELAQALANNRTQSSAAANLRLSEAHLSRRVKPMLMRILLERLELRTGGAENDQGTNPQHARSS